MQAWEHYYRALVNVGDVIIITLNSHWLKHCFLLCYIILTSVIFQCFAFRSSWGRDIIPTPLSRPFRTWSSTHQPTTLSPNILSSNQSCLFLPNSPSLSYLTKIPLNFVVVFVHCSFLMSNMIENVLLADKLRYNSTNDKLS